MVLNENVKRWFCKTIERSDAISRRARCSLHSQRIRWSAEAYHSECGKKSAFDRTDIGSRHSTKLVCPLPLSGTNSSFFLAPSRLSLKMSSFLLRISSWKNALYARARSADRLVELRRLAKRTRQPASRANSLCEVGNIRYKLIVPSICL